MNFCVDCVSHITMSNSKAGIIRDPRCRKNLEYRDPVDGREYYFSCSSVRQGLGEDIPCPIFEPKPKGFFARKADDIRTFVDMLRRLGF